MRLETLIELKWPRSEQQNRFMASLAVFMAFEASKKVELKFLVDLLVRSEGRPRAPREERRRHERAGAGGRRLSESLAYLG